MHHIEKDELERRVDEVLYYRWDPIGVNDSPEARAEYRSYVPKIIDLLKSTEDYKKIAHYLIKLETDVIGSNPHEKRSFEIAKLLIAHKEAIEKGIA